MFQRLGLTTLLFDYREHGISDGAGRGMSLGYREAQDVSAAVHYLKQTAGLQHVAVIGGSLGGSSAILAAAQDPAIDAVIAEASIASFDAYVRDMTIEWLQQHRAPTLLPLWGGWWPQLVVDYTTWRIGVEGLQAPVDVIGQIAPRPILLVHGTNDTVVPPAHARALYAHAQEPRELLLISGGDHVTQYQEFPAEYHERIESFLESVGR
jgi:fermentation-respiration switch protein FrsA (DUF1100 family)